MVPNDGLNYALKESVSANNFVCASTFNSVIDACPSERTTRITDIASIVIDTDSADNDTTECLCLVSPIISGSRTQIQISFATGSPTENRTIILPDGNSLLKGASSLIFSEPPWLLNYTSKDGTTLLPSCFQLEASIGRFRVECSTSVDMLHSAQHRNESYYSNNRDETTHTTTMHANEQNTSVTMTTSVDVKESSRDRNTDVVALAVCVTVIPVALGMAVVVVLLARRKKITKSKAITANTANTGADYYDLHEINDEKNNEKPSTTMKENAID
ncbi:uncharacterized protein LOC127851349 isoform X2 [Dreissena polymorpha]|uniref:uncharacterized protein LOC127851349 isoform X2 n=1 Tax=Dreissena polymorpha TaxID=45954 RepID=UPI002264861E|nr:uncharacterized protein LOC127851349 isoform X2 [Dreissena polymorpha]